MKYTYQYSIVLAVALHACVVGLLMVNWSSFASIEVTPVQPFYIEATVVGKNPYEVQRREQEQQKRRERERLESRREADRKEQARLSKLEEMQQEKKRQEKLQAEQAPPIVPEQEIPQDNKLVDVEAERIGIEHNLALAIEEELNMRRAVTDDEKAQAYSARLRYDIIQNWSRPPSARNGMQAVLRVFLVPTGEVTSVVVEESSGNDAFDQSALLAVRKAERFEVPADSSQFERNFREFTVVFRPEDLRL
ncbi:MAG: cell envelope integrity protein TolA [Gammaproteobacteria bacterium]|nr:cell envelope integrity protein TolA [Gammaproteobacteria bacterium]